MDAQKIEKLLDTIYDHVINGNAPEAGDGVQQALAAGGDPATILNQALIEAMTEVGCRFEAQEYFVPEMLVSARAMQAGLALLKPHLVAAKVEYVGKIVLGTVKGDLHDIGKNLVGMMFEGAGFRVIDLGIDTPSERFVAAVSEHRPDFVGMSALLTTTMPGIKTTIDALQAAGLRQSVKVVIGGAPVNQDYAATVGADLYAPDASTAASRAKTMLLAA